MSNVGLRIIVLSPFFPPDKGGVESFLEAVCSEFKARQLDYRVITFHPLKESNSLVNNADPSIIRIPWFGKGVFDKISHRPALVFSYLAIPYLLFATIIGVRHGRSARKLVLLGNGLIGSMAAIFIGKLLGKGRIVSTFHAVYENISPIIIKFFVFVWSRSDKVLACSATVKSQIITEYSIAKTKTDIFYYWIDRAVLAHSNRSINKTISDIPRIGFIGRLIPEKGVTVMATVARSCNVKVIVYGTGPMESQCLAMAAENKDFIFKGKLEREDLATALCELDFLIIPSFYTEAGPIVLIECLSFGVIPIITNTSGYSDLLRGSSLESLIVDPTEQAVVSCVQRSIAASQSQLVRWREECLNVYQRYFSPDIATPRFLNVVGIKNAVETR